MRQLPLAVLMLACAAAPAAAEEFSSQESFQIQRCRDNLKPAALLPDAAQACLDVLHADKHRLLKKLEQADLKAATELLAANNALAGLGALIGNNGAGPWQMTILLARSYARTPCVICDLGLGPEPEKLLPWVKRLEEGPKLFKAGRHQEVAQTIYAWNFLDETFQASLDRGGWEKLEIMDRHNRARAWARKLLGAWLAVPAAKNPRRSEILRLAPAVRRDLNDADTARLDAYLEELSLAAGQELAGRGGKGFSGAAQRVQGSAGDPGSQQALLDKAFENAALRPQLPLTPMPSAGGAKAGGATVPDDKLPLLASKLMPAMEAELRGTVVGDKVLAFFDDKLPDPSLNKKAFVIRRLPDPTTLGGWSGLGREMEFNLDHIEAWMRKTGVSADDLLSRPEAMQGLARLVAPLWVHEATHQQQTAWARAQKTEGGTVRLAWLDWTKTTENEVEAAGMGALFVEQKLRDNGPAYLQGISDLDIKLYKIFEEKGVRGLRDRQNAAYGTRDPALNTFEEESARVFGDIKAEVDSIEEHRQTLPKGGSISPYYVGLERRVKGRLDVYRELYDHYAQSEAWAMEMRGKLKPRTDPR